jgi:hypothetical protein
MVIADKFISYQHLDFLKYAEKHLQNSLQYPSSFPRSLREAVSVLRACVQAFKSLVECVAVIFRPGGERVMIGSFACLPYW